MIQEVIKDTESKMTNTVAHAKEDLATIRTGRANPAMFNKLTADYYGAPTPLLQLATFQSQDARTILISPFDQSSMASIEKSIRDSDLGVNPTNDGHVIRVTVPQLTEERRKEYVKVAKAKGEDAKIAVRNLRRHAVDAFKKLEKDKDISEDDRIRAEKQIEVVTKKYVDQIDELMEAKEAELLEV